jgi:TonB-linked SusC/RagA family outer membrane protein
MKFHAYDCAMCRKRHWLYKIGLVMRLTALFLLVASLHVAARTYSQKVTIKGHDLSLSGVFRLISQQTGYEFVYEKKLLGKVTVNLDVKDADVSEVLESCLKNQPFGYTIVDKAIVIGPKPLTAMFQPAESVSPSPDGIHGRVVDSAGNPLEGASVTIKGSKRGVQTDAKGNFSLPGADPDAILVISYTGMLSRQIRLGNNPGRTAGDLHITLYPSRNPLDEVQVIAYGTNTRRLSVGSVSRIGAGDIAQEPISNPMEALEGRIAGLDISQTNGLPGSGQSITVRGLNSLNVTANNPLYLVDGVPFLSSSLGTTGSLPAMYNPANLSLSMNSGLTPFNLLNPADIESITVLKDADATAIYGSRGSNGVILITTKKGRSGNQTQVDINISSGFGKVGRMMDLLNTPQYLEMRHEAFSNDGEIPDATAAPDLLVWDTTRYTNWQKAFLGGSAKYNNDQVSISGGNENTHFLVNGSHIEQGTVFPGSFGDSKDAGRFSIDHSSLNKKFKVNFSGSYLSDDNTFSDASFVSDALTLPPDAPPVHTSTGELNWAGSTWTNPYGALQQRFHAKTDNLTANGALSYDVVKGLQIRTTLGYNNVQFNSTDPVPESSYDPALYSNGDAANTFTSGSTETWNIEPQAEYRSVLGPGKLDVLAGMTFEQMITQQQSTYVTGFLNDALLNDLQSGGYFYPSSSYSKYDYNAVFARINYILKDKYIIDLTGRRDGSSRFGPGKQFGNFGSVGAGWLFGDEGFIKNGLPFLSYGKLRGSYGITGSDNIGDYGFISTYSAANSQYGGSSGLVPNNLANPDYSWESNKKLDAGLELGFIKDRILFNIDYYRDRSSNQLVGYPLSSTTGFRSIQYNLPATVQNEGLELEVNTVNIKSSQFSWHTSLNFTLPRNKLINYPNISNSSYAYLYIVGQPLNIEEVTPFAGIDPGTGIAAYYNNQGALVKNALLLDFPQDYSYPIDMDKKFYGGMQNSFQYKSWQLDILLQFVKQLGSKNMPNVAGSMNNQPVMVLGRWQKPGDETAFPLFTQDPSSIAYQNPTYYSTTNGYTDASFLRLKNLSLSYTVPSALLRKISVKNARIYFQGQNLFVITPYKYGPDPETQSYLLPPLRELVFGIQVTL